MTVAPARCLRCLPVQLHIVEVARNTPLRMRGDQRAGLIIQQGVTMPQLSYPGVYIEEVPSGVRTITGVATSIALFIGWAPRGPIDRAWQRARDAEVDLHCVGWLDRARDLGQAGPEVP